MMQILVYDDTSNKLDELAEKLDVSVADVLDEILSDDVIEQYLRDVRNWKRMGEALEKGQVD